MDLVLGLLAVKKLLRKRRRHGQFLAWSSQVQWQEILLWVFHSTFWAFLCICNAPFSRSIWSGHHWKDLFLQQKLECRWCQFWSKAMTSDEEERPRFVTGGYRQHRHQWVNIQVPGKLTGYQDHFSCLVWPVGERFFSPKKFSSVIVLPTCVETFMKPLYSAIFDIFNPLTPVPAVTSYDK